MPSAPTQSSSGGSSGVKQLLKGAGITLTPTNGKGIVTVEAGLAQPNAFVGQSPVGNVSIDPRTPVTVYSSSTSSVKYGAYPGGILCPNGTIFGAFRVGHTDTGNTGYLVGKRSFDGGNTWVQEYVLYDNPTGFDTRGATLALLSTGKRIVISMFIENGSHFAKCMTMYSTNNALPGTWSTPIIVPSSTGITRSHGASPVYDFGTGKVIATWSGTFNGTTTYQSCGIAVSTDGCQSWHSPVTVGTGTTDQVRYVEPQIFKLANGSYRMVIRNFTTTRFNYSTTTNFTTWTGGIKTTLFYPNSADGQPSVIRDTNGAVILCYRSGTSQLIATTYNTGGAGGVWYGPAKLPLLSGTPIQGRYSQIFKVAPNLMGIIYGMAYTNPVSSKIMFGYLMDGFGTSPFGGSISPPRTSIVNLLPYQQPLQTHWSYFINTSSIYNGHIATDGVQGRTFTYTFTLQKGTYNLYFVSIRQAGGGTGAVTLNGASIGALTNYFASSQPDHPSEIATVVVAKTGKQILKIVYTSKVTTSSGYLGSLQQITWVRTTGAA